MIGFYGHLGWFDYWNAEWDGMVTGFHWRWQALEVTKQVIEMNPANYSVW